MTRGTLLQLLTLSIIFTKEIDTRSLNKTNNAENPKCNVNSTTKNKCSVKANESIRNDTVLTKKTNTTKYDQRSDTNLESKYDILTKNKYNLKSNYIDNEESDFEKSHGQKESDGNIKVNTPSTVTTTRRELTSPNNRKHFSNEEKRSDNARPINSNRILVDMAQNTAIDKNKQESEAELDPNDKSLSQNDAEFSILTVRRHKKKTHTTRAMTDRWATEVDDKENDILCKTKHCDFKNHRSFEIISREMDIYRLKRRDETEPESKHANKLKRRDIKSFRTFKRIPISDKVSKSKLSDQIDTISKENENYKLEHLNEIESVEPVKKQVKNPKYKPKFSHNYQRKKHRENTAKKVIDKVEHTSKTKHDFGKVISNKDKNKPTLNGNRDTHTDVRYGECSDNSEDTLNAAKAETQTSDCDEEQETLNSSEDQLIENDLNQPRLPFYISSTTPKYAYKHTIKQELLLDHLNTVLKGNNDINETIDRLASSKILDFITDKVAGHMLKKLQNSQAFKNHFTTTHEEPEKVEHIDILFKNDGDMVMMNREKVKENTEIPDFYSLFGADG